MDPLLKLQMDRFQVLVEQAARALIYAKDHIPGANAQAVCWFELRDAMSELDKVYKQLMKTFEADGLAQETLEILKEKFKYEYGE